MAVFKATTTITAFFEANTLEEAQAQFASWDAERMLYEITDGMACGSEHQNEVVEIAPDRVREELQVIGNDGDFFEFEDEDEDSDPDDGK